jgi:hypothetical protein
VNSKSKSESTTCFASRSSNEHDAQSVTDNGCNVRVFFAAESLGKDAFPYVIEQLLSSFQNVPKSAIEQFAPLR